MAILKSILTELEQIKMKRLASFAFMLMAMLSISVNAQSLYTQDSDADKISRFVSMIADEEAIPLFLHRLDSNLYNRQMDRNRIKEITLPVDHMRNALDRDLVNAKEAGRMTLIPVDNSDKRFCLMTFSHATVSMKTLLHEALHCKTSKYWKDRRYIDIAGTAFIQTNPSVSPSAYMNYFEEALVAHLTVAYAMNKGLDGMDDINVLVTMDKNAKSSIGVRTARYAMDTCGREGSCSLDVLTIANQMMNADGFADALKKDAEELSSVMNLAGLGVR